MHELETERGVQKKLLKKKRSIKKIGEIGRGANI
jgi:hypothetical protein